MLKKSGITLRIVILICITVCSLCAVITAVGARMIYSYTESSVKNEIQTAARTLKKLYDYEFIINDQDAEIVHRDSSQVMTLADFSKLTELVDCSDDIDFTLFRYDVRIFTSVKNSDGSAAVGTKADADVTENVINKGQEYFNRKVMVNGQYYAGCYIPVSSSDGSTVGMCFAGKPLNAASMNATTAVSAFVTISLLVLVVSLSVSILYLRTITSGMGDIKQFIAGISDGDFSVVMNNKTLNRNDEIGDIGQHALKLRDNLRDMVERDPLTTLLNRRSCRKKIAELEDNGIDYAVVMGDIDFFKKINDVYGHAAGDEVLKKISKLLDDESNLNSGWMSRWGGEEFLGVFPDKNIDQITIMLEKLISMVRSEKCISDDEAISVTMTFGASVHCDGETMDDTIKKADDLLYKGKRNGRNRYEI